ncbi:MAG: 5-formyltetrahydrofolate cyclo-ligase [archaeon]|nr:5-formyltetrahydrofolate cyclo-ligase [archaeon]
MDKQAIRSEMESRRSSLSRQEAEKFGLAACNNLFSVSEFSSAERIGVYLSFGAELSTKPVIEKLLFLQKKVFVPVKDPSGPDGAMFFSQIFSESIYKKNVFGVDEPIEAQPIDVSSLDAIIVPGIAFDLDGHRLGWGKGFYDRLFSVESVHALRIGYAFSFQVVAELPAEGHDQKMDLLVTDSDVTRF